MDDKDEEKNIEPLRPTLNIKDENRLWKILAITFIIISIVLLIVVIIISILGFKSNESENNKEDKDSGKDSDKGKDDDEEDKDKDKDDWNWSPAGDRIKTKWGKNLNPEKVWQEYPRPQLQRKEWLNLNGPWNYSIRNNDYLKPEQPDGKILVPFSLESSLSGVMETFTENQFLWYEKEIEIPQNWENKQILLHFGAVDWKCELFINEIKIGEHIGGYSAFYFDITQSLRKGKNKIILKVIDQTDRSYQPVGKQTLTPGGIWYTPISGIWQTVWLEPVNEHYIERVEINNDYDNKEIKLNFKINSYIKLPLNVTLKYEEKIIGEVSGNSNEEVSFIVKDEDFHPWSPSEPNLYYIEADLYSQTGSLYDSIISYTTIRKIESKEDSNGYLRIYLNNKPFFNMGTLDQGYWPDGLYTPPSEEAMIYDIQKLKDLGFNTIRKHIKVEPYRYYYQCDKIGMLLWQDMPAGDIAGSHWVPGEMDGGSDKERTQASKDNYYNEWGEIIDNLKFFQCIVVWVPFNEGWGQFDTEQVVEFTKNRDPLRLINAASGGNHRKCGHFLDLHSYPAPSQFLKESTLINVLGEYGGLGLEIKNHTWKEDNWGYDVLKSKDELTYRYKEYIDILINLVKTGFSAGIYTQTTDVESEINGLITYDREEVKVYENLVKEANELVINSLNE